MHIHYTYWDYVSKSRNVNTVIVHMHSAVGLEVKLGWNKFWRRTFIYMHLQFYNNMYCIDVLWILKMYHVKPQVNNNNALIHKYFHSSVKLLIVFSSLEILNKFHEHQWYILSIQQIKDKSQAYIQIAEK